MEFPHSLLWWLIYVRYLRNHCAMKKSIYLFSFRFSIGLLPIVFLSNNIQNGNFQYSLFNNLLFFLYVCIVFSFSLMSFSFFLSLFLGKLFFPLKMLWVRHKILSSFFFLLMCVCFEEILEDFLLFYLLNNKIAY